MVNVHYKAEYISSSSRHEFSFKCEFESESFEEDFFSCPPNQPPPKKQVNSPSQCGRRTMIGCVSGSECGLVTRESEQKLGSGRNAIQLCNGVRNEGVPSCFPIRCCFKLTGNREEKL